MCQIFLSRHNNIFAAVSPQTAGEIRITPELRTKVGGAEKDIFPRQAGRRLVLSGYLRLNLVASHWQTRSWTLSRARIRREIYFPEKNNLFVFATTEATLLLALEIGSVNLSFSVCGVRVRRYKDSLLYVSLHSTEGDREVTVTRLLQASTKLSNMSCTWKYCFMCIWTLNLIWELSIQNRTVASNPFFYRYAWSGWKNHCFYSSF